MRSQDREEGYYGPPCQMRHLSPGELAKTHVGYLYLIECR